MSLSPVWLDGLGMACLWTRPRRDRLHPRWVPVVQSVCALAAGAMISNRLGTKSTPDVGWKELLEGFSSSTTNPFWSKKAESPSVGLTWFDSRDSQEIVRSDARSCRIYAKSRTTEFDNALERVVVSGLREIWGALLIIRLSG